LVIIGDGAGAIASYVARLQRILLADTQYGPRFGQLPPEFPRASRIVHPSTTVDCMTGDGLDFAEQHTTQLGIV